MKIPYTRKMPAHTEQPEALKKALEKAWDEKARMVARQAVDALTAANKKAFKGKAWLMVSTCDACTSILVSGAPVPPMTSRCSSKRALTCLLGVTVTCRSGPDRSVGRRSLRLTRLCISPIVLAGFLSAPSSYQRGRTTPRVCEFRCRM